MKASVSNTLQPAARKPGARKIVPLVALALVMGLSGCKLFGSGDKGGPKTPTVGERVPILSRIETGAKVDPTLATSVVMLPPEQVNAEWAQGGGTASKAYGHLALAASPSRVWTAQIAGSSNRQRLAAAPVIGDGRLYVMDTDGVVHALDAQSGARLWTKSFAVKGDGSNSVFGGGVSYDSGHVYVTTGVGEVAALEASTGAQIWTKKPAGPLRGAPTVAFNAVYVMTQDNQIFALNATDGSLVWNESGSLTQAGVFGVAAPAAGQGTVIAGYSSGELVAYRYENGRQLWSDALARTSISTEVGSLTDVDADPIIDNGRVYALGQGGRMAAYELVTGQRIWELNLAGISTPAVAGDWVFTLDDHAEILAIARSTGRVRWLTQLMRYKNEKKRKNPVFWVGPVLAGNKLWVANSRGELGTVDPSTGTYSPFTELDHEVTLEPVVANQTLYVLDSSGRITAFR
ncbi:PQQ-binding-like beta-propeller repeat protein [Novosphingobium mangrovi (ex Huang et al. 2023)]|uniref:PQQ-binding-like beta-propeller repeat protein n=1 Tax=Novosphingobium mangrovi (ex Huang et al. 2023) TaxID=2976432 RepID=A0ABT2I0C9_9SPHN|nr:PQQ-binding-like beta-propeller repeat protein [Novosphingobium mangrovi (ex Huang et al. 2023)]MCT2398256.1 PQQ-binding-like beta-propeller repeat protein [Novosphingobium mangrovi (ex Huang et al. 2023)]